MRQRAPARASPALPYLGPPPSCTLTLPRPRPSPPPPPLLAPSCFSSPHTRARQTAELVWPSGPVFLDSLREADLGWFQGKRNDDIAAAHPELYRWALQAAGAAPTRLHAVCVYVGWRRGLGGGWPTPNSEGTRHSARTSGEVAQCARWAATPSRAPPHPAVPCAMRRPRVWREEPERFCLDGRYPVHDAFSQAAQAWRGAAGGPVTAFHLAADNAVCGHWHDTTARPVPLSPM
jgi:hypothetical protein